MSRALARDRRIPGDADIDLRCCDVEDVLAGSPLGAALIHADPPWHYDNGTTGGSMRSGINDQYPALSMGEIAEHVSAAHKHAADDCYLALWCTWPRLAEWFTASAGDWEYVTGAVWGKTGRLGMGFHFRGDSEPLLLYRKGNPKPLGGSQSNLWIAARGEHSEKPRVALDALVRMGAPPSGLVFDLYGGATASLARVCRRLGRRYIGCEIDAARHALAVEALAQAELFGRTP